MPKSPLKLLFGQKLRALREMRAVTQAQLAERIGVTEQYVGMIERGLSSPSFGVIQRLCAALGVSPASLFQPQHMGCLGCLLSQSSDGSLPQALQRLVGSIAYWERNLRTGQVFLSSPVRRMFGYIDGRDDFNAEAFLNHIHPEDRDIMRSWELRLLAQNGPANCVIRFSPRGAPNHGAQLRLALCWGELSRDCRGRPLATCGSLIEITELLDGESEAPSRRT